VVFERGVPNKKHYRRFNIRSVSGPDDFASMEEVLTRRLRRWLIAQSEEQKPGRKVDSSFAKLPDVIIVDGGKGQLSRSAAVLETFDLLEKLPLAALAKQSEELFIYGKKKSVLLPRNSQGLFLLQRIRDEAHRFAITAHRARRSKSGLASQLDTIPGIGPAKRKALLSSFGSLDRVRQASLEDLVAIQGININLAENILSHLA